MSSRRKTIWRCRVSALSGLATALMSSLRQSSVVKSALGETERPLPSNKNAKAWPIREWYKPFLVTGAWLPPFTTVPGRIVGEPQPQPQPSSYSKTGAASERRVDDSGKKFLVLPKRG